MDIRKVKKLIELLEQSGISELEISEGEESVRISRHPRVGMQAPAAAAAGVCIPTRGWRLMRTDSSPSDISSSEIPDCSSNSINFFTLRISIRESPFESIVFGFQSGARWRLGAQAHSRSGPIRKCSRRQCPTNRNDVE